MIMSPEPSERDSNRGGGIPCRSRDQGETQILKITSGKTCPNLSSCPQIFCLNLDELSRKPVGQEIQVKQSLEASLLGHKVRPEKGTDRFRAKHQITYIAKSEKMCSFKKNVVIQQIFLTCSLFERFCSKHWRITVNKNNKIFVLIFKILDN